MSTRKLRKRRVDRGIHVRTRGLYALSSYREMAYLLAPRLFLLVGLLGLPPALDLYGQRVLCAAAVFAMPALAFDSLAEYVGLVCLGGEPCSSALEAMRPGFSTPDWACPPS